MDAHLPLPPLDAADEDFVAVLAEQRARVQEYGANRRQRLQELESDLSSRVERIAKSLDELRQDAQSQLSQAEQQGSEVAQSRAELEARLAELERRDSQLSELNAAVLRDRAAVAARAKRIAGRVRAQRRSLAEQRLQELATLDASTAAAIAQLNESRAQLQVERDQLGDALQARTAERDQAQRELEPLRSLPEELNGLRGEVSRLQEETTRLASERAEHQAAAEATGRQLGDEIKERERLAGVANATEETLRSVTAERDELTVARDRLTAEVNALRGDVDQARAALADSSVQAQAVAELQAKLQQADLERRQLQERLDQAAQLQAAELQSARAEAAQLAEQLAKYQAAEQQAAREHAQLHGRCQELDAALLNVKAEFDRETQQATLRVQSLERDLEGARAAGSGEQQTQQELAQRLNEAETAFQQAAAAQEAAQAQAAEAGQQAAQLREQLDAARKSAEEANSYRKENANLSEQLAGLIEARTLLTAECAKLQAQLEATPTATASDEEVSQKIHALERRYELAMEDLREEKARAAELEQKLAVARKHGGGPPPAGGMDWEAQKLRMLAMLEEYDDGDEEQVRERLTIQGTLEITDAVVAEKDQEIAELRKLLEEQSSNIGNVAVGAAAIAQLVGSDEVIQHERERARQLQAEWEAKMRTAEVEISVERAKLARERAELEEKLRHLEERTATIGAQSSAANAASPKDAKRGRWLERLGLKDSPQG